MRSAAVIGFIVVVAIISIWVASLDTVVSGKVIEKRMLAALEGKGVSSVTCDPAIPIGVGESVFQCIAADTSGATARLQVRMQGDGGFQWKPIETTPAP